MMYQSNRQTQNGFYDNRDNSYLNNLFREILIEYLALFFEYKKLKQQDQVDSCLTQAQSIMKQSTLTRLCNTEKAVLFIKSQYQSISEHYESLVELCKDKNLIKNYTYKALEAEVTIGQCHC